MENGDHDSMENGDQNSMENGDQNGMENGDQNDAVFDKYQMGTLIGSGGCGFVYAATRWKDKLPVAVKVIGKKPSDDNWGKVSGKNIPSEVVLMKKVIGVLGCIQLLDFFERPYSFYIVMERPDYSVDLFDILDEGPLAEDVCRKLFRQVVETTIRCHNAGVLHRDLKDENILVNVLTKDLKIIDFGCGDILTHDKVYTNYSGTEIFSPPEWLKFHRYKGASATVWTLGTLLFNMVNGNVPFTGKEEICNVKFNCNESVSPSLRHLIDSMFKLKANDRITLEGILKHPWMQKS